ncbi:type II secretion system F family protein [Streptomyces sp. DSM 44917]|uniref:Type II secretion system F family protein n=1 Tax=Streptomyces boetiae TaxID=3075541 RepID=A0ABU2LA26_9ACTN|nr:type II secretion system F family protein [Streptomyces sp. DSM 44917]MDT0308414.1 type II secretion system F family protein [Streptomyces sp. DSM 44917]
MTGQLPHFAAALCAGAGAWLLADGPASPRRARLVLEAGRGAPQRPPRRRRPVLRPPDRVTVRCALGAFAAGGLLALGGGSALPLPAALLLSPLAARWWRRRRAEREAEARREAVIAFCAALAAEVRAGRPAAEALSGADGQALGAAAAGVRAAARYGGDVPSALRAAAARPGAEGLCGVAACWAVAVDGGASLAAGLERVAEALRAEREQREELRAQLAGPRATALVLAGLPVFGLLLGAGMGVQPLRVLLSTPVGLGCLLAGAALEWAGIAWVAAIVRSAERSVS